MKLSPKAKTVPLKAMSDLKHLFETNVASGTFQLSTHNSSAILSWSPIVRGLMFDTEPMRKASLGGGSISHSALAVSLEQAIPYMKKQEKTHWISRTCYILEQQIISALLKKK